MSVDQHFDANVRTGEIASEAPSRFCHVVYKTHHYDEMIEWYLKVFQARIQHRGDRLCFLTYDDEHHRMAFLNLGAWRSQECIASAHAAGCLCVEEPWCTGV